MEKKINIAKLLKDCPKGMELDCVSYDNVSFDKISNDKKATYPIFCYITDEEGNHSSISFTENGCESKRYGAKCVIFPKGKTTWEGFQRPFKDGDIVTTEEGDIHLLRTKNSSYCAYRERYEGLPKFDKTITTGVKFDRLATEDEKETLFKAIKYNGYKWNPETKTLEKLVESRFHEGDWVTDGVSKCQIRFIDDTQYWYSENCILGSIESVDKQYHLWTINDAKDGDVLFHLDSASNGIFIFKEIIQRGTIQKVICYCDYDSEDGFCLGENHTCCWTDSKILHLATKEQRDLLFQKIREAGYIWNAETKTLKKLVEPKFKVGNIIKNKNSGICDKVINIFEDCYLVESFLDEQSTIGFDIQDNWELVPNKFDITTLKPFESRVLVRHNKYNKWCASFFSHINDSFHSHCYKFVTTAGKSYPYCIPYIGNEHLLNTTNDCNEFYKTWE